MYELRKERAYSEKGKIMFEDTCSTLQQNCDTSWNCVEDLIILLPDCNDIKSLRKLDFEINEKCRAFNKHSEDYKLYLERQGTVEANTALETLSKTFESCIKLVNKTIADLREKKLELVEAISQSGATGRSESSSHKKAKAAAERVKLEFVKKEGELLKQKAAIEANINIVKQEAVVAAADVEANYDDDIDEEPSVPMSNRKQDVENFVNQSYQYSLQPGANQTVPSSTSVPVTSANLDHVVQSNSQPGTYTVSSHINQPISSSQYLPLSASNYVTPTSNSAPTHQHLPSTVSQQQSYSAGTQNQNNLINVTSDITRYMLRKDFLLSRFVKFDDKAETYPSWKVSFQSIVRELQISPFEEMDLLVKWLGPKSTQYAKSIRSANAHDPPRGVARIWERLQERFGRPEMIESSIKAKIAAFPNMSKNYTKLYDLLDILTEIESGLVNPEYSTLLSYFNSSSGVSPIVAKLPYSLQDKWVYHASKYKKAHSVPFPPFSVFVAFIREMCEIKNDPAFATHVQSSHAPSKQREIVYSRKCEVTKPESKFETEKPTNNDFMERCPIHKSRHNLNYCRDFRRRPIRDRRKFLKDKGICFRCCLSDSHAAKDCTVTLKCYFCGSSNHSSALHINKPRQQNGEPNTDSEENQSSRNVSHDNSNLPNEDTVIIRCSSVCGNLLVGRSCGKTVLVDIFSENAPNNIVRAFALIDDQSNQTLGTPALFDRLGLNSEVTKVVMSTCSGSVAMAGRHSTQLNVRSADGKTTIKLPRTIECDSIPCDYSEIATPEVAKQHSHLSGIADYLPTLEPNVEVMLLIGRDIPQVHHIHEQIRGNDSDPFAQRLSLGWVVIGEVCLGKVHTPKSISVRRTNILKSGQSTTFPLCTNRIEIKEQTDDLFVRTASDNQVGLSVEDRQFIQIMDSEFRLDESGHWSAPLPFKDTKEPLPNNRSQAWKRAQILDTSLRKNTTKREHFMTFMDKVISSGATEVAPTEVVGECWYLPLFGVYHPRKRHQIRGVFDSSAVFEGKSLNSVLMSGPDLLNNLVGVLLRFRKDAIAITGDIEQMFYQFHVSEHHRDYLRFYWYRNNDFTQPLIEYRMKSHVFGNTPSPAIATYGIRKAVENSDDDVRSFVNDDFYVDDALSSFPDKDQAISLLKRTQRSLLDNGKIRLHKIVSNNVEVMKSFDSSDLGKDLKDLNLSSDTLPIQHSLGLSWNLESDMFVFSVDISDKPCTRRGLLSSVNSIFDPMGFLSPLNISGKMLLRELIPPGTDWDEPLSQEHSVKWHSWIESLKSVDSFRFPRMLVDSSFSKASNVEIHLFCDASEQAVSAVAYVKVIDNNGQASVGFVMGKSKLAPLKGHTIPRLELCGAVLAVEVAESVCTHLGLSPNLCLYHIDSKVVLGYMSNTSRRFYTYVSNRVEKILRFSKPQQWCYVPSEKNPADMGTRFLNVTYVTAINSWIKGPKWLASTQTDLITSLDSPYLLVDPNVDKEVRPEIVIRRTEVKSELDLHYIEKFSSWKSLVRGLACIKRALRSRSDKSETAVNNSNIDIRKETEQFIVKWTQNVFYRKEIERLTSNKGSVAKDSKIVQLDPFIDEGGVMRVGGRLKRSTYDIGEKHPILIPGDSHLAKLIIMHYHEQCRHSGRHITEGTIRNAGFWITGLKRRMYSVISQCLICKRFRGKMLTQKMSDLPEERLRACPPFTYVGVDCFGPWDIVTRRTRGGSACSKRWGVIFVCLSCRGIHIEIIEEMTTSSFVNALRRFISVRGKVKEFFSDRGSNFVGGVRELNMQAIYTEDPEIKRYLNEQDAVWKFNTPYSSHHGGSWERLIGTVRRVLDSILYDARHLKLTHELLCTFMFEAMTIVNSRPLSPIYSDHEAPIMLSPNSLLTQKVGDTIEDFSGLTIRDAYNSQWKFVQVLAEKFWHQWQHEYLQSLQYRRKWQSSQDNIQEGDLVIVKDNETHRNQWPVGIIESVYPGNDNLVRKVKLRVIKDGKSHEYVRPIMQIVFLCHG